MSRQWFWSIGCCWNGVTNDCPNGSKQNPPRPIRKGGVVMSSTRRTLPETLAGALAAGVVLHTDGQRLTVEGTPPQDVQAAIEAHRAGLIRYVARVGGRWPAVGQGR